MFKHTSHSSNFILFRENFLEPSDLLQSGLAVLFGSAAQRAPRALRIPYIALLKSSVRRSAPALECPLSLVSVRRSTPGSRVFSVLGDCQMLYPWFLECSLSSVTVRRSALLSSVLCPRCLSDALPPALERLSPWCLSDALPLVLECSLSSVSVLFLWGMSSRGF